MLFPVHLDGTLVDSANAMKARKEYFSTSDVLQIFRQVNMNCCLLYDGLSSFFFGISISDLGKVFAYPECHQQRSSRRKHADHISMCRFSHSISL